MITAQSSLVDVAYAVCTALDGASYVAVVTGGSAATFHAPDAYQSSDIDFVITMRGEHAPEVLEKLGYTSTTARTSTRPHRFRSSSCKGRCLSATN